MGVRNKIQGRIFWAINLLVLLLLGFFIFNQLRQDRFSHTMERNNHISLLFTVYEEDKPVMNQVAFFTRDTHRSAFLDIPTYTGALIPGRNKIDSISSTFDQKNPEEYLKMVESMIGTPLHFYIFMDLDLLKNWVDLLGGVEVFVSESIEMIHEDQIIMIPSGRVLLDGDKSSDYLTYADPLEGNSDRAGRVQRWYQSFLRNLGEQHEILSHSSLLSKLTVNLLSNLDPYSLSSFFRHLEIKNLEQVLTLRLLGDERPVDGQTLIFPHNEGITLRRGIQESLEHMLKGASTVIPDEIIRVEILNGTNRNGLAARTKTVFEDFGYQVLRVGNTPERNFEETVVYFLKESPEMAQNVARFLRSEKIEPAPEMPVLENTDVLIILGGDFDGRFVRD